jgi:hypothetical protein
VKVLSGILITVVFLTGCGIYSFSGSSLPSHLKTVELPLLENQSMEPDIADDIAGELNEQILSGNLLRIVTSDADAVISGSITNYQHEPYTFGAAETRQVDVEQYIVKITAQITFYDNVNDEPLFEGPVNAQGIYDFSKESEEIGKERAIKDMVERILQSSLQSW